MPESDARVALLVTSADGEVGRDLGAALGALGIEVVTDVTSVSAVVVLFSAAALADSRWHEELRKVVRRRMIPVRLGRVADDEVPPSLRELNWIDVAAGIERAAEDVMIGLSLDAGIYRASRDTVSLARQWDESGEFFALTSLRDIRRRERALDTIDPGSRELVRRFLAESREEARSQLLFFLWNFAWRTVVVLLALGALYSAFWLHDMLLVPALALRNG